MLNCVGDHRDKSGAIDPSEFAHALVAMGIVESFPGGGGGDGGNDDPELAVSPAVVHAVLHLADADSSGALDFKVWQLNARNAVL